MSLTGDWAALRQLIGTISDAGHAILPEATKAAKGAIQEQYLQDFAHGVDPWGKKWASPRDGGRPMFRTGQLAGAQARVSGGNTIRINPVKYWVFAQVGANNAPRRAVLPFSESRWDPPTMAVIHNIVLGYFQH